MPVLQQSSEPGSSDPQGYSGDVGNLWQPDLRAKQIELNTKKKLVSLQLLHWFLINLTAALVVNPS